MGGAAYAARNAMRLRQRRQTLCRLGRRWRFTGGKQPLGHSIRYFGGVNSTVWQRSALHPMERATAFQAGP